MLWDKEEGEELASFKGHINLISSCDFSSDGKYIISGSTDRTIKISEKIKIAYSCR